MNATKQMKMEFKCLRRKGNPIFPPYCTAEARLDDSGGHTVDSDVAVSQFRGQRSGQAQECRLTHAVGTQGLQMRTCLKKKKAFSYNQDSYLYKIVFIFYSLMTNLMEHNDDYDSLAGAPSAGHSTLWHYFRISVLFCIVYSVKLKFALFLLECFREAYISRLYVHRYSGQASHNPNNNSVELGCLNNYLKALIVWQGLYKSNTSNDKIGNKELNNECI